MQVAHTLHYIHLNIPLMYAGGSCTSLHPPQHFSHAVQILGFAFLVLIQLDVAKILLHSHHIHVYRGLMCTLSHRFTCKSKLLEI